MASRPPMIMHTNGDTWYLEDFEGREFKTIIPRSVGMGCVGLACGYLIFFCEKTHDIWLVNPITRHELHFPDVPFHVDHPPERGGVRAVLVFSPSLNGWVFVILNRYTDQMWFCIVGKGVWNHVTADIYHFVDLHAFKGRIYTLHFAGSSVGRRHIRELRFDGPVPKLPKLETHFLEPLVALNFISSDENLYLLEYVFLGPYRILKLGFDDMTWVPCEGTEHEEYVLFYSPLKCSAALKPDSWPASSSGRFFDANKLGEGRFYMSERWYFPHDCLIANNLIDL